MFCEKCGSEISDTAAFCPTCGAKMSVPDINDGKEKSNTVYEKTQFGDKLQFLKHPDNAGLKKNIDNNLKSTMIFIVIMLVDSILGFYSASLLFGLRFVLIIVILIQFNKLKKSLDDKLCKNVLLLSIPTLGPFLIFELYSLKKNIAVLNEKYEKSNQVKSN